MIAATRSMPEWMASDMTLTDPIIRPTTSLAITSTEFDTIDSRAMLVFSRFNSSILALIVSHNVGELRDTLLKYLGLSEAMADVPVPCLKINPVKSDSMSQHRQFFIMEQTI